MTATRPQPTAHYVAPGRFTRRIFDHEELLAVADRHPVFVLGITPA